MRFRWILILISALAACAASLEVPEASDVVWASARWPDTNLETLQAGRALYVQKCSGCHHLVAPRRHTPDEWPAVVARMVKEHGLELSGEEADRVIRYLAAMSARSAAHTPPP